MAHLRQRLVDHLRGAHRDESGAVILLMLAAFLIVFMTALVLYDASQSARDKMDVQIAADSAAFSQAAIKSRSMNMIAYANVAKRTFYAFDTMYSAAYLGMIEATLEYTAECGAFNLAACLKAIQGGLYVTSESTELLATNMFTMGVGALGRRFASEEVMWLDHYQRYINAIAPWWGWSEGLTRGIRNGATITSSWPPPPGNLATINSLWVMISNLVDMVFGSDYYNLYPSLGAQDTLPIEKEDGILAHFGMCASTAVSTEYMWMWGEHYVRSSGFARDSRAIAFGILSTPLGCLAASMILGDEVLPFSIKDDLTDSMLNAGGGNQVLDAWLQATSNVVISYKMDQERWAKDRTKFNYMTREYQEGTPLVKGGGYFATTRSEIVYSGGFLSSIAGGLQSLAGGSQATGPLASTIGVVRDLFDQPNMWAARWTARMRPMQLPGEAVPSFNGMFKDMLPYMLLVTPIAFANSPAEFSLSGVTGFGQSAMLDLVFLEIASAGMSQGGQMQGFVK